MTRGIDLNINFKVKAEEFLSHSVTVCEICYAVAIAEHHLMAISREFALAQSIPIKVQNVTIDVARKKDADPKPVFASRLHRWRLLFYFSDIVAGIFPFLNLSTSHLTRQVSLLSPIPCLRSHHQIPHHVRLTKD